jgi:hypothetical protein
MRRSCRLLFVLHNSGIRTHDFQVIVCTKVAGDGEQYVNVAKILVHPKYNKTSQDYDFSLLQVNSSSV